MVIADAVAGVSEQRDAAQDVGADERVPPELGQLFVRYVVGDAQNLLRDAEVSHVVEHRAEQQVLPLVLFQAYFVGEGGGV